MVVSDFVELHCKEWDCVYFIKVSEIVAISYNDIDKHTCVSLQNKNIRVDESYEDLKRLLESRTAKCLYADEDDLK